MARSRAARGYTFVEMAIVVAILGMVVTAFGRVFVTTSGLSAETRAKMRAHEENRRNLDWMANKLRSASWSSLTGFLADGTSTAPGYKCATGCNEAGIVLGNSESLWWRSTSGTVNGVASPGEMCVTCAGVTTVVAPRVPSGGFKITQQGNALKIQLTTYYSTSDRKVSTATSEAELFLRN
jgi:prepilin-type N-terminal cleavage/methylation domain-containing protein